MPETSEAPGTARGLGTDVQRDIGRDIGRDGPAAWSADPEGLVAAILGALRTGQLSALAARLGPDRPDLPMPARLFLADFQVRRQQVSRELLQELFAALDAQPDGQQWRLWLSAIAAEYHLWRGELIGALIAQAALAAPPLERQPFDLLGRGRLRRLLAFGTLMTGGDEEIVAAADHALAAAIDDLEAAGQSEEVVVTHGLYALIRLLSGFVQRDAHEALHDTVDALVALGSDRAMLGWLAYGWASAIAAEFGLARHAVDEIARAQVPAPAPLADHLAALLDLACTLVERGTDREIIDAIVGTLDELRATGLALPSFAVYFGSLLLDAGEFETSARLVGSINASEFAAVGAARLALNELNARVALHAQPTDAAVAEVEVAIAGWVAVGHTRRGAELALRAATDCRRLHLDDHADRLHHAGLAALPANPNERTPWERLISSGPSLAASRDPRHVLRVLGPGVEAHRGTSVTAFSDLPARILVELVLARHPLTTEQLTETIWPDSDPGRSRERLKAAVWRIRQQLSLDPDELLTRGPAGLALHLGTRWRIDLWDYLDLAGGGPQEQARALSLLRHDLCSQQFRYDDQLEDRRRDLHRHWARLARGLLDHHGMTDGQVHDLIETIAVTDPTLARTLRVLVASERPVPG
jgi:hypothetical protein